MRNESRRSHWRHEIVIALECRKGSEANPSPRPPVHIGVQNGLIDVAQEKAVEQTVSACFATGAKIVARVPAIRQQISGMNRTDYDTTD